MRIRDPLGRLLAAALLAATPLLAAVQLEEGRPEPMPPQATAKVSLCHVDVDDSDPERDAVTIAVADSAREAHLAHGDCVIEPPIASGQECSADDPDDNDVCGDQSTP
jgi:hypothetical protein